MPEANAQQLAAWRRRRRRALASALSRNQAGVVSRSALYAAGITRGEVRANVRAGRWRRCGCHAIATFTGPAGFDARHWIAVIEGGPRAMLDAGSSLLVAGLRRYEVPQIRVTVPRGARIRHRPSSINIRQTRRWVAADADPTSPIPRTRNAVAAVRAALWAVSDRQAALVLTMVVQQELSTPTDLAVEALRVRRDRRRTLVHEVILELAGGVRSLGELDVVRGCRQRGLPEPDCQSLVKTPRGTYYLDFRWKAYRVVLEVDGVQHTWAEQVVDDALRHNGIALSGDVVLRLPVLGLRVAPDEFFDQLAAALERAGWRRPDAVA